MTSPFDQSSPFSSDQPTNIPQAENVSPEEFTIRTMRDDLTSLPKTTAASIETTQTAVAPIQREPIASPINNSNIISNEEAKQTTQPFQASQQINPAVPTQQKEAAKIVEIPTDLAAAPSNSSALRIIIAVATLLILGIAGLGAYYFWMTRTNENSTPVQIPEKPVEQPTTDIVIDEPKVEEPAIPAVPNIPTEKYSQTMPNFLVLDLATLNAEDIKNSLIKTQNELKNSNSTVPYEFVVVDANNNPVAFPIFATAAKLNLSPSLLGQLGTNFSLFIYNDANNMRLAIAADVKDKNRVMQEISKEEQTLTKDASLLFLNEATNVSTGTFNSGTYKNYSTRYLNVNKENTLSIDYTVTDTKLFIGTSKNTLRAVLDKNQQTPTNSTSANVQTTSKDVKTDITAIDNTSVETNGGQTNISTGSTTVKTEKGSVEASVIR